MKQGGPLARRTPLAAKKGLARGLTELSRTPIARTSGRERKPKTRRPSEAPFRAAVLEAFGRACIVCGAWEVQAAHLWGKGQGGPTVTENGAPMCRPHHEAYDQYRLKLHRHQLRTRHQAWLAAVGYVAWDEDGQPYGRGARRFAPLTRPSDPLGNNERVEPL